MLDDRSIDFHIARSDDAGDTPKSEAVSRLVKLWESRQARVAAKASGFGLMAVSLAACGGSGGGGGGGEDDDDNLLPPPASSFTPAELFAFISLFPELADRIPGLADLFDQVAAESPLTDVSFAISVAPTSISEDKQETATFTISLGGDPLQPGEMATVVIVRSGTTDDDDISGALKAIIENAASLAGVGFEEVGANQWRLTFDSNSDKTFTFDVTAEDDDLVEGTETLTLSLANATVTGGGLAVIVNGVATLAITEVDAGVVFSITSDVPTIAEEDEDTAEITISTGTTLPAGVVATVVVDVTGTADDDDLKQSVFDAIAGAAATTGGVDFDTLTGELTFTGPASDLTFTIQAALDYFLEGPEDVIITLSAPTVSNGTAILGAASVTIDIDDFTPWGDNPFVVDFAAGTIDGVGFMGTSITGADGANGEPFKSNEETAGNNAKGLNGKNGFDGESAITVDDQADPAFTGIYILAQSTTPGTLEILGGNGGDGSDGQNGGKTTANNTDGFKGGDGGNGGDGGFAIDNGTVGLVYVAGDQSITILGGSGGAGGDGGDGGDGKGTGSTGAKGDDGDDGLDAPAFSGAVNFNSLGLTGGGLTISGSHEGDTFEFGDHDTVVYATKGDDTYYFGDGAVTLVITTLAETTGPMIFDKDTIFGFNGEKHKIDISEFVTGDNFAISHENDELKIDFGDNGTYDLTIRLEGLITLDGAIFITA